MPQVGVKARLPFVPLTDTEQVIRIAQVKFSENRGMREGLGLSKGMGYLFLTVMVFSKR